jgi:hypothetical protein
LQSASPIAAAGRFCELEVVEFAEFVPLPDRFDEDDPLVPLPVEPMLPVVLPLFRPDVLLLEPVPLEPVPLELVPLEAVLPEPLRPDPLLLEPVLLEPLRPEPVLDRVLLLN